MRRVRSINNFRWRSGADAADYEGDDAEYLRLQALQLLLRMQVLAIRKLWNLPEVYEVSVRPTLSSDV
jgi:RNA polymerase I-specific transcription initiation factor RRN7